MKRGVTKVVEFKKSNYGIYGVTFKHAEYEQYLKEKDLSEREYV